ncbi:MAG: hypothetical protein ABSF25_22810 [Bryobacteraceae bacterium]|jgi:hypothetical protein
MKRVLVVALSMLGVLLLLQPAMADVTMQVINSPTGDILGGVYTSPYTIDVTDSSGKTTTTSALALACDDFTTDIYFGYTWTANLYTLGEVTNSGPQKFTTGSADVYVPDSTDDSSTLLGTYSAYEEYYAAAVLADDLLYGSLGQRLAEDYSFAIWQIFDQFAYLGYGGNGLGPTDRGAVAAAMTGALAQAVTNSPLPYTLDIYTPCGGPSGCGTPGQNSTMGPNVSQEFLGISVPEGSALPFLPFDMLALFGGVFLVRRRILAS